MQINSFLSPAFLLISRSLNITVFSRTVNCCNKSCSCFSCFFFFPFASCKIIPSYGQEQFAYLGNEYQKSLLFHCPPPSPRCCPTGNRLYSGLAAVSTRIAVGHNLPLALLHTYSLGLLQAPELAVPAARTAFWSGVCPFSTCAEGQEAPRCPQAALVAVSGMRKR